MVALEYNKPFLDFRQKEIALNYLCSIMVPIEGRLLEVITEIASANKIRLNRENAKEMLQELNYYEMDIAELGSDTEDEGEDKGDKLMEKMLTGSLDDDDESKKSLLTKAFNSMKSTRDQLGDTRRELYEKEMSI